MRRFVALSMMLLFLLGLTGCGGGDKTETSSNDSSSSEDMVDPMEAAGPDDEAFIDPADAAAADPMETDDPAIPGEEPAIPGEEPAIPGEEPAIPGEEPTIPGEDPAIPGEDPAIPVDPMDTAADARPKQPPKPKTLAEHVQQSFRDGRDHDAFQYYYANALTDGQAGDNLQMKWIDRLKRPAVAIRWGLGVEVSPVNYRGNPPLIGQSPRGGNAGGGDGLGDQSGGGSRNRTASKALNQLTGELGSKVVARLKANIEKGYYGNLLKEASSAPRRQNPLGSEGAEGFDMPPVDVLPEDGLQGNEGRDSDKEESEVEHVLPGVVMLGKDKVRGLIDRAIEEDLDVLLVFKVSVSLLRKSRVQRNETKLVLYDVRTRKQIFTTKGVNNIHAFLAREDDRKDPVGDTIKALFDYADKNLRLSTLPSGLTSEIILDRVRELVSSEYENPLPVLAEIRFYNARDLLSDEYLGKAYEKMLGEKIGAQLKEGSFNDRIQAIEDYLPEGHSEINALGSSDISIDTKDPSTPPRAIDGERREIPETGISVIVPKEFRVGRGTDGTRLFSDWAHITVKNDDQSFKNADLTFSESHLARNDFILVQKDKVKISGRNALLAHVRHDGDTLWYGIIYNDESSVIIVQGKCSSSVEAKYGERVRQIVLSAQLQK